MAPKKGKKVSLNEFLGDGSLGSWADEMDNLPSAPSGKTDEEMGRPADRRGGRDDFLSTRPDRMASGPPREDLPLPTHPPYTAFIGNLAFDLTEGELEGFFEACKPKSAKIIRDREEKPKGFGYIEFESLDGLKEGLALSGANFSGRTIRVSVAEPPKERSGFGGGDDEKFDSPWRRDGPLPDLPSRDSSRRPSRFQEDRLPSVSESPNDWRSAMSNRAPSAAPDDGYGAKRRKDPAFESSGAADSADNWVRGAKFKPAPAADESRDRDRDSGSRFGGGRGRGDMGPPPTPKEEESDWRSSKPARSETSPTTSTPPTPQMRRKLELLPRSGTASGTSSPLPSPKMGSTPTAATPSSRSNPFGAAKPVDVSAREQEVLERHVEKDKDRFSMSRNSSRSGSTRHPVSGGGTSPTPAAAAVPSSPRTPPVRASPAANVRPTFSFAKAAGSSKSDDADVQDVTAEMGEVKV